MKNKTIKIAIIDLYNNEPNQGMRCIQEIIENCSQSLETIDLEYSIFETRFKNEVPAPDDFDIYLSSGGPGSPFEGVGKKWEDSYFRLIDNLWSHNQLAGKSKKYVFFICHSFQMMCRFFKLASIQKRNMSSFGILPIRKTATAKVDPLLGDLPETYFAADFRQFEVVQPKKSAFSDLGAQILSREKSRIHQDQEKALMAIRISDEFFGTQYHPEADPESMLYHFLQPERKKQVIAEYGTQRYDRMISHLEDPGNILLTRRTVLPGFLMDAVDNLMNHKLN